MGQDEREEIYSRIAASLAPVYEAQKQMLGLMVGVRVTENDMANVKERLAKLEAASERAAEERAAIKDTLNDGLRRIESNLGTKADRTELTTVDGHARANEFSVGKLIGICSAISVILPSILYLLFRKL